MNPPDTEPDRGGNNPGYRPPFRNAPGSIPGPPPRERRTSPDGDRRGPQPRRQNRPSESNGIQTAPSGAPLPGSKRSPAGRRPPGELPGPSHRGPVRGASPDADRRRVDAARPGPTDRRPLSERTGRRERTPNATGGLSPTHGPVTVGSAPDNSVKGTGSDAIWSLALESGRLFAGLTTFYLIAHVLGDRVLGFYAAISGFVSLLNTLATTWLPQWVMESIVRRRRPAGETLRAAIGANVVFAVVIGLGALFAAPFLLKNLLQDVALRWILLFLFAELIANCSAIWISMWAVVRGYAASCRLSLVYAVGRPTLYIVLWVTGLLSLRNMAMVAIGWSVVSALVVRKLTERVAGERMTAGGFGRRLFIEGAPYAMTNVAYSVQEDLDKPLMIEMGHSADAGPYAAAYRIIQIAMVPLRSLVMATHLRFLQAGQRSGPRLVIRQAIGLSIVSSILAIFLGAAVLVCQPLIVIVLGPDYALARPMLLPLIPLLVLRGLSWFPLNGLMALGHLKERVAVLATSATVNVVLNIALIRRYSWRGAVMSTISAEAVFAIMAWGLLYVRHRDDFGRYRGMHFRKRT